MLTVETGGVRGWEAEVSSGCGVTGSVVRAALPGSVRSGRRMLCFNEAIARPPVEG